MWPVTPQFLASLTAAPLLQTVFTYTVPGGQPVTCDVESGSITVDSSQVVRRQGQVTITGDVSTYQAVSTPGTIVDIQHGVRYGNITETVPVFHGEITTPAQDLGGATVALTLGDMSNRLGAEQFITPYSPVLNTLRTTAIANLVTAAIPGIQIVNTCSDSGFLSGNLSWQTSQSPTDVITALAKDAGAEAFFLPDGSYLIRDRPVLNSSPVWTTRQAVSATRTRPTDQMFNTVVVQPGTSDGTQKWTQQVVSITDTTSPLYFSKIGVRPYIYQDNSSLSTAQAVIGAQAILSQFEGTSESLALGLVNNPALEGSDVIGVAVPGINLEPPQFFRHFIDNFSLDLQTGAMTLATRTTQLGS